MEGYERLSGDIACIDTYQHSSGMAACYLVGTDGHYAFVESGTSLSVPHVMKVLAELGVARGARHMIDPSKLIAGATAAYGPDIVRATYGEILPVPESRVIVADVAADRDFTLDLGSRRLLFIDSPGHARHHYAIWDEATRGWFSGDIFGVSYREFDDDGRGYMVPTTTPVQFDLEAWEASLARLLAKSPSHVYLTHYNRVDDVEPLARALREGLAVYQRIAHETAGTPDRHARIAARLMDFHLGQLRERHNPVPEARARELLAPDVEINTQGLEVWLDRQAKARDNAHAGAH